MNDFPTFFFSHARQDREMPGNYLSHFFGDLEKKLPQWAAINLSERKLGTIDSRVKHGDDWDAELSLGLSDNSALLAIISPLYFKRPNCGKELALFLQRSRDLGVDSNGALTGVKNVMVIRWLPEKAYTTNGVSVIPPFLRRIEDTRADHGSDEELTQAIELYQKRGDGKLRHQGTVLPQVGG